MAKQYTTAGSSTTVRVLSQSQVVDVQAVGIYTKPSGVFVVVQVPLAAYQAGNADDYLSLVADLIEGLLAGADDGTTPEVAAVTYVQSVDASGLLSAFLAFTVQYVPSGVIVPPFETTVTLPLTSFETAEAFATPLPGGTPAVQLLKAYDGLKKLAGL